MMADRSAQPRRSAAAAGPQKPQKTNAKLHFSGWVWLALAILVCGLVIDRFGGTGVIPGWQQLERLVGRSPTAQQAASPCTVTFFDVGQGDAVLIGQDGAFCLIDTGPTDSADSLCRALNQAGVERLDYLVLTHPDADHIGGAVQVLRRIAVEELLVPFAEIDPDASGWQDNIYNDAAQKNIPVTAVQAGQSYALGGGRLQILLANYRPEGPESSTNDRSVCLRYVNGDFSFLDTGDAEWAAESELVRLYGRELRSTLMKAGHHGSATSNSGALLGAVRPRYVAISCGKDNPYGHPHEQVLRGFAQVDAQIFRTDEDGTLVFTLRDGVLHTPWGEETNDLYAA